MPLYVLHRAQKVNVYHYLYARKVLRLGDTYTVRVPYCQTGMHVILILRIVSSI